jgi:hypothetical protein
LIRGHCGPGPMPTTYHMALAQPLTSYYGGGQVREKKIGEKRHKRVAEQILG